ncbi:MAG: C45 family peptidase [Syntrophomonadaceae bacterium]|nr:C45 family peptidase [Syntrophomonadaceae bacterium]
MKNVKEFKLVECSGTPYEIGYQWGGGCKESIMQSVENNFNGIQMVHQASKEQVITTAMKFFPLVQDFDPYLIEILKGQADGSGISFEEIFTQKCSFELAFYYKQIAALCTSFAATGNATEDGQTILGQTIDWAPGTPIDLIKIRHSDGLIQLVVVLGHSSEYTISSAGFGICANSTIGQDYSFNIPLCCYLPKVMRQKNIHDAMGLLKQAARGFGYYHLADASGTMLGIESVHNDYELLYPKEDLLLHSNHYITERFQKGDLAPVFIPDSYYRLNQLKTLMNQHYGRISPEVVMDIMADHDNHPHSICSHIDLNSPFPSATLAALILVPAEGAIYIAAGNPCENEFVRYEL